VENGDLGILTAPLSTGKKPFLKSVKGATTLLLGQMLQTQGFKMFGPPSSGNALTWNLSLKQNRKLLSIAPFIPGKRPASNR
jgi:hypothetical protein